MNDWDMQCLDHAISEAEVGLTEGGIPIGAVLATADDVLGAGHNRRIQLGSPIRHGEMDALEIAGRQPASIYRSATMYTTLAPCDMCTGAILLYDIPRVVVGENRTYVGAVDLLRSRGVEVIVADSAKCIAMMESFISDNPALWDEDIGE
jgi:cytosine deaminase